MSHPLRYRTIVGSPLSHCITKVAFPDSKIHGANVGPTWGRQDPGGPHVGHMNLAIWVALTETMTGFTSKENHSNKHFIV